jgi:hypothetical protein
MNKREGETGYAALNFDMSKAYDGDEWMFLGDMVTKMGFAIQLIYLTMECVTTAAYRIKVIGHLREGFKLERGLTHDDPLSPYMFFAWKASQHYCRTG